MQQQGILNNGSVYRTGYSVNERRKELFSAIFVPENLAVTEICVTHILTVRRFACNMFKTSNLQTSFQFCSRSYPVMSHPKIAGYGI